MLESPAALIARDGSPNLSPLFFRFSLELRVMKSSRSSAYLSFTPRSIKGCGERNDESRIVGGSAATVNSFPWMARLSYFNRFYCGEFNDLRRCVFNIS